MARKVINSGHKYEPRKSGSGSGRKVGRRRADLPSVGE